MLYRCLRPLLFQLDAERAHGLALGAAKWLSAIPAVAELQRSLCSRPSDQPVELLGMRFPHRVGVAAGLDKNAVAPWAWWGFGFGFVEFGTVTPKPQGGNPRPRMFRFPEEGALVNRMGFNNDGAAVVAERLGRDRRRRPGFPILVSVGKNATTPLENAEQDYEAAASIVAPCADMLSLNISSPNTPGLRSLQTPEQAARLVSVVKGVAGAKPVLVKFAPELEGEELLAVVDSCLSAGASGFIATNTLSTKSRSDLPEGGLSGRPVHSVAVERVASIRKRAGAEVLVIGCGGIDDVSSAQRMRDAGADLVQIYTGLVYHGPLLGATISRGLCPRG
jgi:dihydroorotate dehydrogenase